MLGFCLYTTSTVKLLDIIGIDLDIIGIDHIVKTRIEESTKRKPTSYVSYTSAIMFILLQGCIFSRPPHNLLNPSDHDDVSNKSNTPAPTAKFMFRNIFFTHAFTIRSTI